MSGAWELPRLLAWLRGVGPRLDGMGPYDLLELRPIDDLAAIRDAYHRIASSRHPDLFRGRLEPADAEALMRAFARISGAYAQLRDPAERQKHVPRPAAPRAPLAAPSGGSATPTPSGGTRKLSPRAMSHARRAEAMLGAGDLASAILHLRMAVAADPQAQELRTLLAETEARLKSAR